MIRSLRKTHLRIWMVLAISLPAGIIAAALSVPRFNTVDKLLQPSSPAALSIAVDSIYNEHYKIIFRKSDHADQLQLEFINRTGLANPSSLIYLDSTIVGRIENTGIYRFPVKYRNGDFHFQLIDIIHNKKIDSWVFHM